MMINSDNLMRNLLSYILYIAVTCHKVGDNKHSRPVIYKPDLLVACVARDFTHNDMFTGLMHDMTWGLRIFQHEIALYIMLQA